MRTRFPGHALYNSETAAATSLPGACSQVAGLLRNPDTGDEVWDEWLRYAP